MLKKHSFIYFINVENRGNSDKLFQDFSIYFSLQANRTQSLNYGCIVENHETNEVLYINMTRLLPCTLIYMIWRTSIMFDKCHLRRFLFSLYSNHHSFLSGAPFCGETRYFYKWHYQLWDLFVHTRYFWPYWDGFPEEPTREDPVSVTDIIQPLNRFAAFTGQIYVYRCISLNHVVEKFICFSNSTQIVKLVY